MNLIRYQAETIRTSDWRFGANVVAICLLFVMAPMGNGQQAPVRGSSSGLGDIQNSPEALRLLTDLADESLKEDISMGRVRISVRNGTLSYDLAATPVSGLPPSSDRMSAPLELLIRTGAWKRDLALLPNAAPLLAQSDRVRAIAQLMIDAAYANESQEAWQSRQKACEADTAAGINMLQQMLHGYAAAHGLTETGSRDFTEGYRVSIKIEPASARIKFMPFLVYQKSLHFHIPLDANWNDLTEGSRTLIGRYHYRAEWPASLSGPEEGNFEVRENTTVTFKPAQK